MDNILIYRKDMSDHLKQLGIVLDTLRLHQLVATRSKCSFSQRTLEYLGHIISDKGVATDDTETKAMLQWPVPSNVTELRGFFGTHWVL